jgi:hypothetical protein
MNTHADSQGLEEPRKVTASERAVLQEVLQAMRQVRHGSIQLAVQDGRVIQVDVTEKRRL